MNVPDDLRYSTDHEWVRTDGGLARVGITDYAAGRTRRHRLRRASGSGRHGRGGGLVGEIESTKSVSEVYAPVGGRIVAVNSALADAPEQVNADPYGAGWICEIELSDPDQPAALLDAAAYRTLIAG